MIVNSGGNELADHIAANYRKVKIGDGADTTSEGQTNLDHVVATATVTPDVVGSTLVYEATFSGSSIPSSGVSELGIFHTTNDTLLSRVTFTNTGVVAASDSITFTIRIQVGVGA